MLCVLTRSGIIRPTRLTMKGTVMKKTTTMLRVAKTRLQRRGGRKFVLFVEVRVRRSCTTTVLVKLCSNTITVMTTHTTLRCPRLMEASYLPYRQAYPLKQATRLMSVRFFKTTLVTAITMTGLRNGIVLSDNPLNTPTSF